MTKTIIFTDLDGTLLHPKNYSFTDALPALELIREREIPLVLCSSKTRRELELYRKRLKNRDPFIVENGGAIFAPTGYFPFLTRSASRGRYVVSTFGQPYREIRKEFERLRKDLRIPVKGFGDMTAEEIAALTGLPCEEAVLAHEREFGEPFVFEHDTDERFLKAAEKHGLHWTRGRLFYLMGDHDKGGAVRLLKQWYERKHGMINTIGLGDAFNDLPLLKEVDHPVLVQKDDGSYDPDVRIARLIKTQGIGPAGWNRAIMRLLGE